MHKHIEWKKFANQPSSNVTCGECSLVLLLLVMVGGALWGENKVLVGGGGEGVRETSTNQGCKVCEN